MFGERSSEFAGEIDKSKATSVFAGGAGQPRWKRRDGATGAPGSGGSTGGSVPAPLRHPPRCQGSGERHPEPMATLLFPCPWKLPEGEFSSKETGGIMEAAAGDPGSNASALHTVRGINSFTFGFI